MRTPPGQNSLAQEIAALAAEEGCNDTRHPGVHLWRVTRAEPPTPIIYRASFLLVGSGRKVGFLDGTPYAYDSSHYLTVTSPLPMRCRTDASAETPVLTLSVPLEPELLREVLFEVDQEPHAPPVRPSLSVVRAALTPPLEDVGRRLLRCLRDDVSARVLARQTLREFYFLALAGPAGESLRALAHGPTGRLGLVLRYMNERYAERLPVEMLARMAHMSVPSFHSHFKATTASSPLQYLKAIRLTRARQKLATGMPVKEVAQEVGYASEFQFSREYRRFHGIPPSEGSSRHVA